MRSFCTKFATLSLFAGMIPLCLIAIIQFYKIKSFSVVPVKQQLTQLRLSMTHDDVSGKTNVSDERDHLEASRDYKEPLGKEIPTYHFSGQAGTADSQWNQQTVQEEQAQTSDNWPVFSKKYFPGPIPRSPFQPNFTMTWDFDTTAFLQRPDVKSQPPKLMTWMVKTRYTPSLPEPVRLRVCPEMPCRMTTNHQYRNVSAALMWAGQIMREPAPPLRSHHDQVFIFHNNEPQKPDWIHSSSFRKPAWKSAFNWTMTYRSDSDIVKRQKPPEKNYTSILHVYSTRLFYTSILHVYSTRLFYTSILHVYSTRLFYTSILHVYSTRLFYTSILHVYSTRLFYTSILHVYSTRLFYTSILALKEILAAQMTSHCQTFGQRENYVKQMQKHAPVDVYGDCSSLHCPRGSDDKCLKMLSSKYKFYLAFENAFCKDYISEKFFRYMDADFVVVARGSNEYKNHAPTGTFINTADFRSAEELVKDLLYLDKYPEEYLKILQAKDQYQSLYEDWPIRSPDGKVQYMSYHYEALAWCETCRRLWELEKYRSTIQDITVWFDKHNCYPPSDL